MQLRTTRTNLTRAITWLILAATVAGCGTMLPDKDFVNAEGTQVTPGQRAAAQGSNASGATAGSTIPGTAGSTAGGGGAGAGGASGDVAAGGGDAGGGGGGGASGPNQASDTGVTETSIKVGNITAINGALGPDAFSAMGRGAKLYFQAINDQGGINGRKVDFVTCDDAENPNQDKACAQKLIEGQGVFALVGNATDTYAAASYVNAKQVPDVGSYPIGNAYYKYPYLFTVLGSQGYPRDGSAVGINGTLYAQTSVYRYFKQQVGVSKAAVLYYSIAISKTAGQFIKEGLKREGVDVVYEPNGGGGILPTQQSYDSDVITMRNAGVDGIWNAIDIAGFQKLCVAMDRNGFTVKANVTTSQGWSQKVGRDFSSPCRNSIYANSVSVPYSETGNPAVAAVNDAKNRYDPQGYMHQWVLEGWAGAKLFDDGVRSMGPAPTRKGLVDWLNSQVNYTAGGLLGGTDWRTGGVDFGGSAQQCYGIGKWDDGAQTFANALAPDSVRCENSAYYPYVPVDDGS